MLPNDRMNITCTHTYIHTCSDLDSCCFFDRELTLVQSKLLMLASFVPLQNNRESFYRPVSINYIVKPVSERSMVELKKLICKAHCWYR